MSRVSVIIASLAAVAALSIAAYPAFAASGTVSGIVKYDGVAPTPKKVEITKDKDVCGAKLHFDESLIVGKNGGIANAVVIIKGAKGDLKPETVKFDQIGCDYVPHVLAFPAGSTVDIINSDGILHNIHTYSKLNPSLDMAQPKFKKVIAQKIEKPEIIPITCDAHGWMKGWWVSTDTPYFAVTDSSGHFTIKDVPPGSYVAQVWQETLGTADQKIEVKDGATTTADFSMKPKG